jgi:beta-galactosidase
MKRNHPEGDVQHEPVVVPAGAGAPGQGGMTRRALLEAGAGAVASAAIARSAGAAAARAARLEQSFDEGWRFYRGDAGGAEAPSFDDSGWRKLDVPHDWRIEDLPYATSDDGGATADPSVFATWRPTTPPQAIGPFDANAVDTGGRSQGYTVAGIGWYRKHFAVPKLAGADKPLVEVRFDGVYQNCDVWLNGAHLGFHPNGYTSFAYDLTPHLKATGENVLAVRVDNRGKTSRWYSGSGIYRHTWLTVTGPVRIPLWGVMVTTPVANEHRSVARVEVQVANSGVEAAGSVRMAVLDSHGRQVAAEATPVKTLAGGATETYALELAIPDAALWSPEAPNLYQLRTEVLVAGKAVDAVNTAFGVRSLVFNGTDGFLLNGKPFKISGGNIHHDHGPLGSAAIDRAEERTVEILKAAGFNTIRMSHNPRSPYMLDVCDRLGMLVYDEFTDIWDIGKSADDYHRYFPDWWSRDLTSMVLRDRNHPSVIIWSIGNEISRDPNNYGPRLAALVRSLDATRPVALGGMNLIKADPWKYVDIGDYHGIPTAADHAAHPDKAFIQSEYMVSSWDYFGKSGSGFYGDWKLAEDNPWVVGNCVWAAWDFIGESGSGPTPVARTAEEASTVAFGAVTGKIPYSWFNDFQCDIDLIGQRKPQNYWRAVVKGLSPLEVLVERPTPPGTQQFARWYAYYDELPSWTWDVPAGQAMIVHTYTSGDSVTLLLNDAPLETKTLTDADMRVATFSVSYSPGSLTAIAKRNGVEIGRKTLTTAGKPAALRLASDVKSLTTGRGDLAHVLVQVVDAQGHLAPDAVVKVSFQVSGAGALAGVGNGNPHNVDSFQRPRRWTWHGTALAILRPSKTPGSLSLSASAEGLKPALLTLPVARGNRGRG